MLLKRETESQKEMVEGGSTLALRHFIGTHNGKEHENQWKQEKQHTSGEKKISYFVKNFGMVLYENSEKGESLFTSDFNLSQSTTPFSIRFA